MPSETRASGGTGNDVGNARMSAIFILTPRCPASAVHVFAAHQGLHGAVGVEDVALEAHEVLAVDVDLPRVLGGRIVHGVYLVVGWHESGHGAGLVTKYLAHFERHLASEGARARGDIARLLDRVLDHPHQPPGLMIVRAGLVTRPPDHGGDIESRAPVEDVAASLARRCDAILGGNRLRVAAELLKERRRPAGDDLGVLLLAR